MVAVSFAFSAVVASPVYAKAVSSICVDAEAVQEASGMSAVVPQAWLPSVILSVVTLLTVYCTASVTAVTLPLAVAA